MGEPFCRELGLFASCCTACRVMPTSPGDRPHCLPAAALLPKHAFAAALPPAGLQLLGKIDEKFVEVRRHGLPLCGCAAGVPTCSLVACWAQKTTASSAT